MEAQHESEGECEADMEEEGEEEIGPLSHFNDNSTWLGLAIAVPSVHKELFSKGESRRQEYAKTLLLRHLGSYAAIYAATKPVADAYAVAKNRAHQIEAAAAKRRRIEGIVKAKTTRSANLKLFEYLGHLSASSVTLCLYEISRYQALVPIPNARVLLRPLPPDAKKPRPHNISIKVILTDTMKIEPSQIVLKPGLVVSTNAAGDVDLELFMLNKGFVYSDRSHSICLDLLDAGSIMNALSDHIPTNVAGIVMGYIE